MDKVAMYKEEIYKRASENQPKKGLTPGRVAAGYVGSQVGQFVGYGLGHIGGKKTRAAGLVGGTAAGLAGGLRANTNFRESRANRKG